MLWYNHIPISILVSGSVGGFVGVNIFSRWESLLIIVVLSLLPDIDVQSSLFGKLFRPLSRWLNMKYGHRTITHSIFAYIAISLILWLFILLLNSNLSAFVLGFSYFAHIIADTATKDGVRLLSPLDHQSNYGLPSNIKYRFGSSYQTQFSIFGTVMCLNAVLFSFMSEGFWTTYNKGYATPKTLFSEKVKSTDLLKVDWKILEGSIIKSGSGLLVDAENEDQFTLLQGDSLVHFDTHKEVIKETKFVHTGKKYFLEKVTFININADSLNVLIQSKIIINLDVSSLETFQMSDNGILTRKNIAKLKFPNRLHFQSLDSLPIQDTLFQLTDLASKGIENELQRLDNEYKFKLSEYSRKSDSLRLYDELARNEREEIRKEKLMKRRDEIHVPDYPQRNFAEETYLKNSLVISRQKFAVEQEKQRFEKDKSYNNKLRTIQKTLFTGIMETVRIE
jgi:inner membrane protein